MDVRHIVGGGGHIVHDMGLADKTLERNQQDNSSKSCVGFDSNNNVRVNSRDYGG